MKSITPVASSPDSLPSILRELRTSHPTPEAVEQVLAPYLDTPPESPPSALLPPLFDLILHTHPPPNLPPLLHLLAIIASTSQGAQEIAHRKGVQLLFHTLLTHKEALHINLQSLRALTHVVPLTAPPIIHQFFGTDVIVTAAKTFIDEPLIQVYALQCLIPLARTDKDDDETAIVRRAGHARAALRVLKRYRKDATLSCMACELLTFVVRYADGETLEQLGQIGTVRMLMASIMASKDEADVISWCCEALSVLVTADEESALQLVELRGAELVLRNIKRFRGCERLQLCNLTLLKAMTDVEDTQAEYCVAAGGVESVLSCMIEYRDSVEIQMLALALLDRLTWLGEEVKGRILSAAGGRTISASLKFHIRNQELVSLGVTMLKEIGSKP